MKKELKIAAVYTGMPVSLVKTVEQEIAKALDGMKYTILTLSDPSIINDAVKNGCPGAEAVRRLFAMYMNGILAGADVVYNICSSAGDIADAAMPLFKAMGVPLVRMDEEMARAAIASANRIGVLATLPSTLNPTKRLISRVAKEAGREVEIVDILAGGAFGVPAEEASPMLVEKACAIAWKIDCILLAQGSMADNERAIAEAVKKPVFSSPSYGAVGLKRALSGL